jgi:hypothetical protein
MTDIPKIAPGADLRALQLVLEGFTPHQRREWYIKANMSAKGIVYADIAKDCRTIEWFVGAQVRGKYSLSPKVAESFERILGIDLLPFLSFKEQGRYFKAYPERLKDIGA